MYDWFVPGSAPRRQCSGAKMKRCKEEEEEGGLGAIKIKIEREDAAECSHPKKPARRLVRRAPTTAPCTGVPKSAKVRPPKKRLKAKNLLSILCPDEVLGLICQNQSFNHWEQLTRNYCENHIIEYMAPHACKKKGLPHFGDNGDQTSLLHPGPSPPVTLSKPTAFLGHYPRRGRPYPA